MRWSRGSCRPFFYELLLQTPKAEVRAVLNKIIKKAIRCDGGVTLRGLPGQELRRRPPLQAHVPRGLHKGVAHQKPAVPTLQGAVLKGGHQSPQMNNKIRPTIVLV